MFDALANIDEVRLNFSPEGLLFMNITLAFIMFGVALEIKTENFLKIFYNPKSAILGVISQVLILPGLTFMIILIINPPSSIAMGMILIAACPGGNVSNFVSALARGNVALSVSLTAFSTLSATLITPANFAFWGSMYVRYYQNVNHLNIPIEIDFLQMFQTVFLLLGLPLILGMWFSNKFPKITKRILKTVKISSIVVYMIFIFGAIFANLEFIPTYVLPIAIVTLLFNSQTLLTGYIISTIGKISRIDRRTISIETGIQNSGLALVLIFNPKLFNGNGGMAFMAAWWGIWQMLSGIGLALILSRIKIPVLAEAKVPITKISD
ncbi:MAG: bile acid:sodium symporter family protein [Bacteroidales bacterium]|nr:bile acid:sodium symporter family protein [Bacteroidales bacterium]MBN2757278.1 bile acid:sodium symporter family protein [Bacteroidales bacterium]